MKHIEKITRNDNFLDKWAISFDWGETIAVSDNPSHPQGVFSSIEGDYFDPAGDEVDWEDLPDTLQHFVARYIAEECEHDRSYQTDDELWHCPDCNSTLDDEGEILRTFIGIPY